MQAALQRAWLRRGPLAIALWPLSGLYRALTGIRRALYRSQWLRPQTLPVPVVVVGNLIVGGAGKTPTVMAVVQRLQACGHTPAVISRGHAREAHMSPVIEVHPDTPASRSGDEPLLLRLRLKVPVFVGADRVAAARAALAAHPRTDVLVSDDGLQHLRLPRAAQVVVFDERGAGNGWLLPAGPLREPLTPLPPARTAVLYNASKPTTPWPGHLAQRRLAGLVDLASWWAGQPATMTALHQLAHSVAPVVAAAGVARPERFFGMLRDAGLSIAPMPLPDHHRYATLPWAADVAHVVVTEKDAVKLRPERIVAHGSATQVWVAPLDLRGDATFDAALQAMLPSLFTTRTTDGHTTA